MGVDWQKVLLAAGASVGVGAALYYLLRDDPEGEAQLLKEAVRSSNATNDGAPNQHDLKEVMQEMVSAQEKMKTNMKALAKEMAVSTLPFDELYDRVEKSQPQDPLEKRGLSMQDLESMLMANTDPAVMGLMAKVMGAGDPGAMAEPSEQAKAITVEKITAIHVFMLEQLTKFFDDFKTIENKGKYDMKTVVVSSQAYLDSQVMAKFQIAPEDIESAIMRNREKLGKDVAFVETHKNIQATMERFISSA
jgi:hypothetical protein